MINGGLLGIATLAIAATSVPVHAFPAPEGLTEGDGSTTTTTTSSSSSSHTSGSVHCASGAISKSYTKYKDAYVEAITNAIASLCGITYWPYVDIDFMYKEMSDYAHAFARAVVEAGAECVSSASGEGVKVEGCAYADASAYAWEYAYVDVHAEAAAQAFTDYCGCGGDASAIDWAKGSIKQILTADAFANVDVTACVTGNDHAAAYGYVDCWADIWAYAVATSLSKAYVYSSYFNYCYSEAYAEAKITVDSWVYESTECTFIEFATGLTDVNTGGGADTDVRGRHLL